MLADFCWADKFLKRELKISPYRRKPILLANGELRSLHLNSSNLKRNWTDCGAAALGQLARDQAIICQFSEFSNLSTVYKLIFSLLNFK